MKEMISRRLTSAQKTEILEAYRAGDNTNLIAKNYNCTANTINRTVKTLLSENEYKLLKKNRANNLINKKQKIFNNKTVQDQKDYTESVNSFIPFKENNQDEDISFEVDEGHKTSEPDRFVFLSNSKANNLDENSNSRDLTSKGKDIDENHQNFENNFKLIAPLITSFEFDQKPKNLDFEILNYESLPQSVYMIVDKKVELEIKSISDLPEWSFLPEKELQRKAIMLFSTQRSAKRICSRNERVIKIPNTSVFELSKAYLISKGITRLIFDDSIIGLDQ